MRIPLVLAALACLCLGVRPAAALEVTAISPTAAAPGQVITVSGGPFGADTEILLGEQTVRPQTVQGRELTFTTPPLPAGEYGLRMRSAGDSRGPVFTFRIMPATPRLRALSPASIDACSLQQRQAVAITGDFPPQSRVLLDGALIPTERVGSSEIAFELPPLEPGMHQVEVVAGNGDQRSLPHALFVNTVPEIFAVREGDDFVTSYEVVINGENFLFDSILAVNGNALRRSLAVTGTPLQTTDGEKERHFSAVRMPGGEDFVRYVDCSTLIYIRHPVTRQAEKVTLQVINPGGEQSRVYEVVIP